MDRTSQKKNSNPSEWGPRLRDWPLTAKVLATMIIVMMSLGLSFAVVQIIVHDIIPTFSDSNKHMIQPIKTKSILGNQRNTALIQILFREESESLD